tara:strand:- start:5818 stop:6945 length:1128 start_codon:yes stop_codon:yes gene_type:complete
MPGRCILCAGDLKNPLSLNNMPASAQGFTRSSTEAAQASIIMDIFSCQYCGLVQYQGPLVPYYKEVIRSTRLSDPMLQFRNNQFSALVSNNGIRSVFELGAGGGEYLDVFKFLGVKTYGIEGSKILAHQARESGHSVYDGFFPGTDLASQIGEKTFDLVTSFNFIEHLPDPLASLRTLTQLLNSGGKAILEVPNFDMISQFGLFNEFISDHRSYFTEKTFSLLLSMAGLEILSVDSIWENYILSAVAEKRKPVTWTPYLDVRSSLCDGVEKFFSGSPALENAIWSAGHQSLATISNLQLEKFISCIIDSSPNKQSTFSPASSLPIVAPDVLSEGKIKRVLLAAAGFNSEISLSIKENFDPSIKIAFLNKGVVEFE